MSRIFQFLFFLVLVRPLVYVFLGMNVRNWDRLPRSGPAIIAANHNSHLDTLVLISLLPLRLLHRVRPVAAADYFMQNRLVGWFATRIIGILPISRNDRGVSFLRDCAISLENDEILILFPEGTRGEPEEMNLELKRGLGLLAKQFPDVEVIPVFLHGLGKSLPKGTMVFVPFFCDVFVGTAICYGTYQADFMKILGSSLFDLSQEGQIPEWR